MPTTKGRARAFADLERQYVRFQLDRMLARGLERLPAAGAAEPVRELHWELTHRCNLKCVMCEHWQIEHLDPASVARELDFDGLRAAVDGAAVLDGVTNVVITGGEPWLRHDLVDILAWLSRRFPAASIIALTNFWNTGHLRAKLAELRARGVRSLRLGSSLDGLEATHDRIRGQSGAFAGLVRTVRALRAEFPEYPFGFTLTILPENAREVYRTYRYVADELGSALGCQWAVETEGIAPIRWSARAKAEALRQLGLIVDDIARRHQAAARLQAPDRDAHGGLWSDLLYWHYLIEYGRNPRRFPFFLRCTAGERHVMLDPEGAVFFCPVNREKTVGRVTDAPLDEIWSSPRAREVRRYVASGRCHCWLRCVSTPAVDRLLRLAARPAAG